MNRLTTAFVALLLGLIAPHLITSASMPFNASFDVFVWNPTPGANSNLRIQVSTAAGSHPIGGWSVTVPNAWDLAGGNQVTDGDTVARGTMSIDTDCDGSVNTYGPFDLVDLALDPDSPIAEWSGQITSWWDMIIAVDREPGQPLDMSVFLPTGMSVPHSLCGPHNFVVTVFGRSSPSNDAVLTNPGAGSYLWEGSFSSLGGGHIEYPDDSVCAGGSCDLDSDGGPDVQDNCPAWSNAAQNLPPWLVPPGDSDCDGFSTALEDYIGTNPFLQCGVSGWPADLSNNGFSDTLDISFLTSNFGAAVPPAPARYNMAPDPPQPGGSGFVDTSDIAKMTAVFGLGCSACAGDLDCDGVANAVDNCPNWPNPAQTLPPWSIPASDPDCDGFSTALESYIGTNPFLHCGSSAWPADLTDNGFSDTADIAFLTSNFGAAATGALVRYDMAPDPPSGPPSFIDTGDIAKLTSVFSLSCL